MTATVTCEPAAIDVSPASVEASVALNTVEDGVVSLTEIVTSVASSIPLPLILSSFSVDMLYDIAENTDPLREPLKTYFRIPLSIVTDDEFV